MAKENVTIQEDFELPSKGLIYGKPFDPHVTLRSMTVEDEMKRLSPSNTPYKNMSEIIESCLSEKLPVPVYNLCLGDYTYLLHKLRVVTYGPMYSLKFICPYCGNPENLNINLDDMKINKYTKSLESIKTIKLPVTGHELKLRFQTPKDLDNIAIESKRMKEDFPDMTGDPTQLLTLQSLIDEVDGQPVNPIFIKETLKKLPMMDASLIAQTAIKFNEAIGVDSNLHLTCKKCGADVTTPFRYTSEFFGPTI